MKLALLISGTYRSATDPICDLLTWLRSQQSITQVDVYIHCWWHASYVGKRYRIDNLTIVEEDPTNEILERIKPVKLCLEEQQPVDLSNLPLKSEAGGTPIERESANFSMISQMMSLQRCYALIPNPEDYDVLFRCRGDMVIDNPSFQFTISKEELMQPKVWVADGQFFTGWPYGDWAFLGNPAVMKHVIQHWELLYKHIYMQMGLQPHIHTYVPIMFHLLGLELVRWYIPLKTTRFFEKYSKHYKLDTNPDLSIRPFFWHMIPEERFLS